MSAVLNWVDQQRMCERKARYASRIEADIFNAEHHNHGMRVYPCPVCGGYHLTSLKTYSGPSRTATAGRPR